jgi:RNA polymerase sigma-70 factor (ECF subfamily)
VTAERTNDFEPHRAHLFGVAYRMLGSVADAEDVVQEAWLRWQRSANDVIRSPRAWLTTTVTRLCLNHLDSARVRREQYVGAWLPEPLVAPMVTDPRENELLVDSLSVAFLIVLESLTPTERAVFLLREVFGYEFSEIALAVEKSEENCRQILVRARQQVEARRPRFDAPSETREQAVERFLEAMHTGKLEGLLAVLAPDVKLVADGGGRVGTARAPIDGAPHVARFLVSEFRKHHRWITRRQRVVLNGQPGVLYFAGPLAVAAVALETQDDHVTGIYVVANPDKLRHFMPRPARLLARVLTSFRG